MTSTPDTFQNLDTPMLDFYSSNFESRGDGYNWYAYVNNDPINYIDPLGLATEAKIDYDNKEITVETQIYIYGDGATQTYANMAEQDIMDAWADNNGQPWVYTDEDGTDWTVEFDVSVDQYDANDPTKEPNILVKMFNGMNNYIEVDTSNTRSNVVAGRMGTWRADGRGTNSLADDNPSKHEYGHILGLEDHYTSSGAEAGWDGNIMAESVAHNQGKVEQKNIDPIAEAILHQDQVDSNPNSGTTFLNSYFSNREADNNTENDGCQ